MVDNQFLEAMSPTRQHQESPSIKESIRSPLRYGKNEKQPDYEKVFQDSPKKKDILKSYQEMGIFLEQLDIKIGSLLRQHEEDFLAAYLNQMMNVQNELKQLKKKIDEETLKQKTDDKILILEEERNYFRSEALRLDKACKEQLRQIDELKFKNQILQEDKTYYEGFVIEAKKENKALKAELVNLFVHKKAEAKRKKTDDQELIQVEGTENGCTEEQFQSQDSQSNFFNTLQPQNDLDIKKFGVRPTTVNSNQIKVDRIQMLKIMKELELSKENEEKQRQKLQQMKEILDRDQLLIKKLKVQASSQLNQKSDLEQILLECIRQVKKEISQRKLVGQAMLFKQFFDYLFLGINHNIKILMNQKILNHLHNKIKGFLSYLLYNLTRRLIEYFLSHENVIESLYLITFGNDNPKLGNRLTESWRFQARDAQNKFNQFKQFQTTLNQSNKIYTRELSSPLTEFSKRTKTLLSKFQNSAQKFN